MKVITLFLTGDVMAGRGIDQILAHPSLPELHEPYVKNATTYIELAEERHGPILKPVSDDYIWGEALSILNKIHPDLRIINLETTITTSNDWEEKGINYRMHPKNIGCLTAANIDCCVLANNHSLDWGRAGLIETLETLSNANIKAVGAGKTVVEAQAPAIFPILNKGRVIVFSLGDPSSGIPKSWAATWNQAGVNFLGNPTEMLETLKMQIAKIKQPLDVVVVSIHWGGNWGYEIDHKERSFAHELIDKASVDIVHGHSSHHVKGIEVYKGKLILYGCGDLINDYEGIGGYEQFRGDLGILYFATIESETGNLSSLKLVPVKLKKFQLQRLFGSADNSDNDDDALELLEILNREGKEFGTQFVRAEDGFFEMRFMRALYYQ